MHRMTPHGEADLRLLRCAESFGVAFAELLWPPVRIIISTVHMNTRAARNFGDERNRLKSSALYAVSATR